MSAPKTDAAAIRQTIRALNAAGMTLLHVDDGEDLIRVRTEQDALDAITAVDDATLIVNLPAGSERETSHVRFVLGNEPYEVICDHGLSLSPVLDPLTERWEPADD